MNFKVILTVFVTFSFLACSSNEAEKQQAAQQTVEDAVRAQQAHDDSIRMATEQRMQAKHDLELQIMNMTSEIQTMKQELVTGNSELEVAIDRLQRIKEW